MGELGDHAQLDRIIKEINGEINSFVDHVISSEALHEYIFSKQKTGFIFNILRAYLRAFNAFSFFFKELRKTVLIWEAPLDEADRHDDENQKRVTISKSFDIMITEVTQMQWFLVMGHNPSLTLAHQQTVTTMSILMERDCVPEILLNVFLGIVFKNTLKS